MNTQKMRLAALVLAAGLSGTAQAALESRLDGLAVYDTDLDITWLANANLAATNNFGVSGINTYGAMSWFTAQNWIGAMNTANYLGYNNWALPTTLQPDANCTVYFTFCTGSQLAHLYYSELGGSDGNSIMNVHNAYYSLFNNVMGPYYWSGTEYAPDTSKAWAIYMGSGALSHGAKTGDNSIYVWAVRPGDVALACTDPTCAAGPIPSVPEPEAFGLMLSGLGLVGFAARRRAAPKSK